MSLTCTPHDSTERVKGEADDGSGLISAQMLPYAATESRAHQCPSFQFQAIASAASSSRETISSGSRAIGADTHA
jgi:hypothetical protein